jgi:hypothetical protein
MLRPAHVSLWECATGTNAARDVARASKNKPWLAARDGLSVVFVTCPLVRAEGILHVTHNQEGNRAMIGPDQDLSDFPRWLWPYIRTADLAQSKVFAKLRTSGEAAFETQPELARTAHLSLIVQAIGLKVTAAQLPGDVGKALATAADRSIGEYIDDYCGTPPSKHPPKPHVQELATELAVLAASFGNEKIGQEFARAASALGERAR